MSDIPKPKNETINPTVLLLDKFSKISFGDQIILELNNEETIYTFDEIVDDQYWFYLPNGEKTRLSKEAMNTFISSGKVKNILISEPNHSTQIEIEEQQTDIKESREKIAQIVTEDEPRKIIHWEFDGWINQGLGFVTHNGKKYEPYIKIDNETIIFIEDNKNPVPTYIIFTKEQIVNNDQFLLIEENEKYETSNKDVYSNQEYKNRSKEITLNILPIEILRGILEKMKKGDFVLVKDEDLNTLEVKIITSTENETITFKTANLKNTTVEANSITTINELINKIKSNESFFYLVNQQSEKYNAYQERFQKTEANIDLEETKKPKNENVFSRLRGWLGF